MPIERAVFHSSAWVVYWTAPGDISAPPGVPIASFSATLTTGTTIAFDATTSNEPGGTIVSYAWDFGDGKFGTKSASPTINHSYATGGTYTVTLTVVAADGASASSAASVKITVVNKPPIASFVATPSGLTISIDATSSSDADGQISSYDWNFGDGGTGSGATVTHAYATAGTYTVTLTVTDNLGATGVTSRSVSFAGSPVAAFTTSITNLSLSVDASASRDNTSAISSYAWSFGDGATGSGMKTTHTYATAGTYTVALTITDAVKSTSTVTHSVTASNVAVNQPPQANFTPVATNFKVNVDASASLDPDGSITSYAWNFGDSGTATGVTASHTYAAAGTYPVTLTVTDNVGATATSTKSVVITDPSSLPVYLQGDMMEGISTAITSKGITVYNFASLGLSTSVTNLQTVVDAMPAAGIVQLPPNWTGHISSFNYHGSNYGIWQSKLMGLLGNMTSTGLTTTIIVDQNAETATQGNSLGNVDKNGAPRPAVLGDSTRVGAIHLANSSAFYCAGIRFQGNDQIKATDTSNNRTGPALWFGFSLNSVGAGSIFQNCLMQGFGRADDGTPPGEVGNWNETHSVNLIFRRVEHDGRIPVGTTTRPSSTTTDPYGLSWRRGGGIQWNAASNFLMQDVYSHDTWASGVTMSFTSLPTSTGSESNNWTTRRLRVKDNANHGTAAGSQNSGAFAAVNHEFNWGTIHHYQPQLQMSSWPSWTDSHFRIWDQANFTVNGVKETDKMNTNFKLYVHQPIIDNANPLDGGCLSIHYHGAGTAYTSTLLQGLFAYPIVYLTSDETKPAKAFVKTTSAAVPSYVTPAGGYFVIKLT